MRRHLIWIALCLTGVASAKAPADGDVGALLKPTTEQAQAGLWAARFLTRFHYKAEPLDNAMSERIFDRYLDSLDADRLTFLQSDIDKFKGARDKLDDAIYDQDLSVPFAIFNLYGQRYVERLTFARSLLTKGFDFGKEESYSFDREKANWAKSEEELNDLWRKRVKNDWLRLKLAKESASATQDGKAKPRDLDTEIRETLDKRYLNYVNRVRQLKSEDVFQTFMNAYAVSIEPHTNYLGPRASENFDIAMRLSLEGIGAVLQSRDEYTEIREIVPGGPAALSGKIKVGDRIGGVGQGESGPVIDVLGWRLDDVVEKIRGAKDSVVRLDILPADGGPDAKHELLTLTRKKVTIEEQAAKSSVIELKDGENTRHIGVVSLPTFYQDFDARRRGDKDFKSATRDVAKILKDLKKQNVDGVLVDLRNNGGGSLNEATELTGLFITKGPVVQVKNAQGRVEAEEDVDPSMAWDGPLAVLVNRNSASASEIFAAAIQDYGRGVIIGEPTYGKGTVQNLVDLDQVAQNEKPSFGELKMTIAQFFRINGGSTQLRGVTPDISFPVTGDFEQNGEQANNNALPWTSIAPAKYQQVADLKAVVPMLLTRHDTRVLKEDEWRFNQEDITDYRKVRAEKTVSLNEQSRRQERDADSAKRKAREAASAKVDSKAAKQTTGMETLNPGQRIPRVDGDESTQVNVEGGKGETPAKPGARGDDGLQADERSLKSELAQEQERKQAKDVVLQEAAHILADEVALIRADTKLAARVLPHTALGKNNELD